MHRFKYIYTIYIFLYINTVNIIHSILLIYIYTSLLIERHNFPLCVFKSKSRKPFFVYNYENVFYSTRICDILFIMLHAAAIIPDSIRIRIPIYQHIQLESLG